MDGVQSVAVLFDLDFSHSTKLFEGVRAYAERHTEWKLLPLHATQESVLDALLRERRLAGVIGPFLSDRWLSGLPGKGTPMVNISGASRVTSVPSVIPDDRAIGRLAAEHLLESGCRRLACVLQDSSLSARYRAEGFTALAHAHGVEVARPPAANGYSPHQGWEMWLSSLRGPCGVFCTNDFLARQVVALARRAGCAIPDKVAILGVGDSALDAVLSGVGLSSIQLPAHRIGELAAASLADVMAGAAPALQRVPPVGLAIRESTLCQESPDPIVARALICIRRHLAEPLDVMRLAREAGASRRTLELRFRRYVGRTPAREIEARRMRQAEFLLSSSDLPVGQVAAASGYPEVHHFSARFKALHGCAPGAYRQAPRALSRAGSTR